MDKTSHWKSAKSLIFNFYTCNDNMTNNFQLQTKISNRYTDQIFLAVLEMDDFLMKYINK